MNVTARRVVGVVMLQLAVWLSIVLAVPSAAERYSARQQDGVIQLEDSNTQTVVSIVPSVGNVAFSVKVKGQQILWFPYASLAEFESRPGLAGIPFLAPWANRLDEQAFYANGKKYTFNMELGNVRGAHPIHGFVSSTDQWQVVEAKSDGKASWATARLEFFRQPAWMAQFPFAHTVEMTHRLQDGVLEITTRIHNLSTEPMPVAIGFHPYFQLTDSPRDAWTIAVGARTEWVLAPDKIPTGETRAIEQFFPNPAAAALKDFDLDHVFGDLIRDSSGRAVMSVKGKSQKLDVVVGPNYRAVVVYAPSPNNFICFEPMASITNALNMTQRGLYKELQSIPPGQTWEERFWVRPSGF
ncbi:MAG: aldose 1-epimerase [Acidobacteria bacterium]|nr:aldose 1-epimerase [Acidobacteriota bacterium]